MRVTVGILALAAGLVIALASGARARAVDSNCKDFATQADAQNFFLSQGGPSSDPYNLDPDHDGVACRFNPCPCSFPCGEFRWGVKTLSDQREKWVRFKPRKISVAQMRVKKPPVGIGDDTPRIKGVETTTWRVQAQLVAEQLQGDHDIHLLIAVPGARSHTMIVEFPDTSCEGVTSSPKKPEMSSARSALVNACGDAPPPPSFKHLQGRATITGVGFYDIRHGQTGVAPHAVELHPVLSFSASSCRPAR